MTSFSFNFLHDVNTEVCEQLFSWLSRFSIIMKHMSRWWFLFLLLYHLDQHNEDIANNKQWWLKRSTIYFFTTQYSNTVLTIIPNIDLPKHKWQHTFFTINLSYDVPDTKLLLLNPQSSTCRCSSSILCCGSILYLV